jgi:mevalonate pyrophosphate decarboxylase
LPLNDSLGVTLDQEDINTETTVTFSKNNEKDCFILNEEEHKISSRMSKIFNKIKTIAYEKIYKKEINV